MKKEGRSFQYAIKSLWSKIELAKLETKIPYKQKREKDKAQSKLITLQTELNDEIKKYIQMYGRSTYFDAFLKEDFEEEIRDMVEAFVNKNSEIKKMRDSIKNLKKKEFRRSKK